MAKKPKSPKQVEALRHEEASRKHIPTAEYQSVLARDGESPVAVRYPRGASGLESEKAGRNRDLDPQLVWRGKVQCFDLEPPYGNKGEGGPSGFADRPKRGAER